MESTRGATQQVDTSSDESSLDGTLTVSATPGSVLVKHSRHSPHVIDWEAFLFPSSFLLSDTSERFLKGTQSRPR